MKTDKEKLIELVESNELEFIRCCLEIVEASINSDVPDVIPSRAEFTADRFISNGVTIQKHGQWEESADGDGNVCSVCGEDFCNIYLEIERFNYCPNCGARMEATYDC